MKKLYLFLYIPDQPVVRAVAEWHELATIDPCYTGFVTDMVEQFRLADVSRGLSEMRKLILVTAESHEDALEIAKTKI